MNIEESGISHDLVFGDLGSMLREYDMRVLGEMVAYGALLEALAAGIHGALLRTGSDDDCSSAATVGLRLGELLDDLLKSDNADISLWATETKKAVDLRNKFVHTAWLFRADFDGNNRVAFGLRSHKKKLVASVKLPADLEEARDLCRLSCERGRQISATVHGVTG